MLQIRTSSAVDAQALTRRRVPIRTALIAVVAAVAVAFTLPAAATAAAKPTRADKLKARSSCADERGLTRARHKKFSLKYGVGSKNKRAFSRCVSIKARKLARRRGGANLGIPGLPGVPMLPGGIPEMPGVRLECQMAQMEDPIGFAQEYLGADPIEMCVMMESMP
jgi:hypothetical protein